jgi:hypothetical protein
MVGLTFVPTEFSALLKIGTGLEGGKRTVGDTKSTALATAGGREYDAQRWVTVSVTECLYEKYCVSKSFSAVLTGTTTEIISELGVKDFASYLSEGIHAYGEIIGTQRILWRWNVREKVADGRCGALAGRNQLMDCLVAQMFAVCGGEGVGHTEQDPFKRMNAFFILLHSEDELKLLVSCCATEKLPFNRYIKFFLFKAQTGLACCQCSNG